MYVQITESDLLIFLIAQFAHYIKFFLVFF